MTHPPDETWRSIPLLVPFKGVPMPINIVGVNLGMRIGARLMQGFAVSRNRLKGVPMFPSDIVSSGSAPRFSDALL